MNGRTFLPLFCLLLVSCAPVIKSLEPTKTTMPAATVTPVPSPAPSGTPEPEIVYVTAAESLHVRVRPGEQQAVIGYLYNADTVTLTDLCQDGWAQIAWNGSTAWVNASFLSDNICQTNEE